VGKNVAVFVDVANIFYAAKAAGVDIDYVTLLRSASAGRDLVRAYAYTGLDPDNENQRNFHSFLARNGYKVVSKDIRKYGDGKVKANLDIELVVDMMKTARNLDIAIVVSGDGDFAPAIRAVQEMGVRCEVISFRGNTSSDLIEVADLFTDITQLAKVEKGSRSGRRVAEDDQDLSMTEVPDKQTEGTGRGRGRGRGRDRDREPAVAAAPSRGRGRRRAAEEGSGNGSAPLVTLPGERLSKTLVGGLTEADLAAADVFTLDEEDQELVREGPADVVAAAELGDGEAGDAPRRRRRRGGRGRGRGRGRAEGEFEAEPAEAGPASPPRPERAARQERPKRPADEEEEDLPVAPRPRSTPFGSVWDSQLGTSSVAPSGLTPLPDEEFDDEPEIPEYLIAERNRGRGQTGTRGRGGARGGRAAYQSAIARERFGRGGGGGINRYPDVSERTSRGGGGSGAAPRRESRSGRDDRAAAGAPASRPGSEWSEVPPELEELLRAQLGQKAPTAAETETVATEAVVDEAQAPVTAATATTTRRRTTRKPAATATAEEAPADAATPPKRSTRKSTAAAATAEPATTEAVAEAEAPVPARKPRRSKATAAEASTDEAPKPRRRTTKSAAAGDGDEAAAKTTTTRRRTTRKATTTTATSEPA
jgi:uncharacterized LabA/DUF88 family protein